MNLVRYVCLVLAWLFFVATIIAFVAMFDRVETTSRTLAGACTGFSMLAIAITRMQDKARH